MNSDCTPLLATPPKRKHALLQPLPALSPWEAIRVADNVRASIKRAKKSSDERCKIYDAKRKIKVESFTNPTPVANVGGFPPLPKCSNAVLLFNVGKKFQSNLAKYGWEKNPTMGEEAYYSASTDILEFSDRAQMAG